jgi:serine/threonine protein kinase
MNFVAGDQIGPYVIVRSLGQGGMGEVFLADDSRLHRKVALKYLFAAADPQGTIQASVLREAEAVARINHPNVAVVYDVVEHAGSAFIVMEYVDGETLSDRLAHGRLQMSTVIEFGRQLASALAAAHSRGIIHRDLKPANIQVTPEGRVKILDFGVARVCDLLSATATTVAAGVPATTKRTLIGTLGYMSPEQMLGQSAGPASDLFSLGVVLFEMATGQHLFPVPEAGQILARISKPLPLAHEFDPQVPFQLSNVIATLLEGDSAMRVQAAQDVERRLGSMREQDPAGSDTVNRAAVGPSLQDLRRRLILARGQSEIERLRYEVERYLVERPHDVDGRVFRDDIERALSIYSASGRAQAPQASGGSASHRIPIWGVAGTAVVVALMLLIASGPRLLRKRASDTGKETAASTTTAPPTTTSIPAPRGPTPEEVFQDHYAKAQAFIQQANKASAREENTLALAALPEDARGVAQRAAIDAMPTAGAAPRGLPDGTVPAGTVAAKPPAPPFPETLRVSPRQGETEKDRANREKVARSQLDDGRKLLADRQFDQAITALQSAIRTSGRSDYGVQPNEAASMLSQARNNKAAAEATQRHASAQKLVEEAKGLAGADVAGALGKLREARNLDPELEGLTELANSLAEQARVLGENALSLAKNLENRPNRLEDAIREYERAVRLLEVVPEGHKDLASARQRLAVLKGGK